MPVVMCGWCQYLGQGKGGDSRHFEDELNDVIEHEKTCSEKPEDDESG